jgi:hypothetical protein
MPAALLLRALALAGVALCFPVARPLAAPEPSAFVEDFAADPSTSGWQTAGDSSLFRWNADQQHLEVTWDSSRPNSFFHRSLGRVLTRRDDFSLAFDLRVDELAIGTTPGKPFTFQLAVGFINLAQATQPGFWRGTGTDSPNVVEFDYFPDSGFGATVSPTIISSNMQFATSFNFPLELPLHETLRVSLAFDAQAGVLRSRLTRDGQPLGELQDAPLDAAFTDFAVDHVAVCSYSDAGQDPQFAGSIRARGIVDNFFVATSRQPTLDVGLVGGFAGQAWQARFTARAGWTYQLQRTGDLQSWTTVSSLSAVEAGHATLTDAAPPTGAWFYRVVAQAPGTAAQGEP